MMISLTTRPNAIDRMLATHPHPGAISIDELSLCVEATVTCATTCRACADACLAEKMVKELVDCIRTNLDCVAVCQATATCLLNQSVMDLDFLGQQLSACQRICATCAAICGEHGEMHEHCAICAQVCRQCEQACARLLKVIAR